MKPFILSIFICTAFLFTSCQEKSYQQYTISYKVPYDFKEPDKKYKLPKSLNEISGIGLLSKNKMLAVQDEKAILYIYSLKDKEIKEKIEFGKNNDYEGLCFSDNAATIISSSGVLYHMNYREKEFEKATKYELKDFLGSEIEGIEHDKINNQYLIAYKGKTKHDNLDERSVYRYSNEFQLLENEFTIGNDELRNYFKSDSSLSKGLEKVLKNLTKIKPSFYPSDIAIHPNTRDIYLLSSVNELLIILDAKSKQIQYIHQFKSKTLPQPEGITFEDDGTLFISSEKANKEEAVVLKFEMK